MRLCIGLAAPLALLCGLAPALAQQTVPPPSPGASESTETRQLESEIESYPGPSDGVRGETGDDVTRIPEEIHPAPRKAALPPRAPSASRAQAQQGSPNGSQLPSSIDAGEVQRVFGSDVSTIALGSLDPAQVTKLQVRLQELGHYRGTVDGIAGPQTRAALGAYARAQQALKERLLQNNLLTTDLARQLGVAPERENDPGIRDDMGPAMRRDAPVFPPGGAPLPPPGMAPLPTPSSAPPRGATPTPPPPSP